MENFDLFTGASDTYGDGKSSRDFRLYRADDALRRKVWLSQLTAARMQCSMYDKKLYFGKASPLLEIEHLAATRSLSELKDLFDSTLDSYQKKASDEYWWPPSAPIDLHFRLKERAAEDHPDELYKENLDLQTSLLLTCTKLYSKDVLSLVDYPTHV